MIAGTGGAMVIAPNGAGTTGNTAGSAGMISSAMAGTMSNAGGAGTTMSAAGSDSTSAGSTASGAGGSDPADASTTPVATEKFSFFVTSYAAMERLSGSPDGFGGDLRYGEADGLSGADKICTEIAEYSMKGAGGKGWRAFLSVTKGPDGNPIHAIDRVGAGPWYDRLGRLLALTKADLMTTRPTGADPAIVNDLPNEDGVPNMAPDGVEVDNHDILTGSNEQGQVYSDDWGMTCHDWTSSVGRDGTPRVGHSWPRMFGGGFPGGFGGNPGGGFAGSGFPGNPGGSGGLDIGDTNNWMSALTEAGCAPGAMLIEMGPPNPDVPTVGSGGGYGGIYCFALMP